MFATLESSIHLSTIYFHQQFLKYVTVVKLLPFRFYPSQWFSRWQCGGKRTVIANQWCWVDTVLQKDALSTCLGSAPAFPVQINDISLCLCLPVVLKISTVNMCLHLHADISAPWIEKGSRVFYKNRENDLDEHLSSPLPAYSFKVLI